MKNRVKTLVDDTSKLLKTTEDSTISGLNLVLNLAFKKLEDKFNSLYERALTNNVDSQATRLTELLTQLSGVLELINEGNVGEYQKRIEELLTKAHEVGIDTSKNVIGEIDPAYPLVNVGVNIEAVKFAVENASARLKNHSNEFKAVATNIIGYNLTIGSSAAKTARDLQQQLGLTKGKAETIARTETLAALNEAAEYFYEENLIDYVQIFATADERVCAYCSYRNQRIYKRGEIKLPLHPRCRCFASPVRGDWLDKGLIDKQFADKFHETVVKEAEAAGISLNSGPAPFEKLNFQKQAPTPVWNPGEEFPKLSDRRPEPEPKTEPKPKAKTTKTKTKPAPEPKPKPINYDVDQGDYRQLINLGEEFFAQNFDSKFTPTATQKKILDGYAKAKAAIETEEPTEKDIQKFIELEPKYYEILKASEEKRTEAMKEFRAKLLDQQITFEEAEKLVDEKLNFEKFSPDTKSRIKRAYIEAVRLSGGKGLVYLNTIKKTKNRAYASPSDGYINVGTGYDSTQIHEFFHFVEVENSLLTKAAVDWRNSKAISLNPKRLNKLIKGSNYGNDEIALEDKYINPYVGKVYGKDPLAINSTEVLSMGAEEFITHVDMQNFYERDRDHFMFTLGVMLSKTRG